MFNKFLYILLFFTLDLKSSNNINSLKSNNPIQDASSQIFFENIKDWKEFQVNLTPDALQLGSNTTLLFGIPLMGHYNADYNYLKRLALISINPIIDERFPVGDKWYRLMLANILDTWPKEKKITWEMFGDSPKYSSQLTDRIKKMDVKLNFIILGTVIDPKNDSPDKSYNLIFHPWVGLWHKKGNLMEFFNEDIQVGIFDENGLRYPIADIARYGWEPINVIWHAPASISPNNARVPINTTFEFSRFASVAISDDKQYMSMSFFLLANTIKGENFLVNIIHKSNNILQLGQNLRKAISENKEKFSKQSLESISGWLNALSALLPINMDFIPEVPLKDQISNLYNLNIQLRNLDNSF